MVVVDWGNEVLAESRNIAQANCSIKIRSISSRNLQADSILERFHQTIGNTILTFNIQDMVSVDESP